MTPKDKAKELLDKFIKVEYLKDYEGMNIVLAKQCALISVDEILDASLYYFDELSSYVIYWQEVKQEIEKL